MASAVAAVILATSHGSAFCADLRPMTENELLAARVRQLEELVRAQERTIAEIVNERDAARLLNELCHY